jgi:hypothetical protein
MAQLIQRSGKEYYDLAYISRLPHQTWANWEKGRHSPRIKPHQLAAILEALDCTQEEFVAACKEIDDKLNS